MFAIKSTLTCRPKPIKELIVRSYYFKFGRVRTPPLQKQCESPYIVGPYLKPDYLPREYITEPLKDRHIDDFEYHIYTWEKVEPDPERKIKLLLIDDVEGLGIAGQVVEGLAKNGAARLVAMKKAEYYSDFALKWYKFGQRTSKSASSALSPRTARLLRSQIYQLPITSKTPVQPWHISLTLRLSGCVCPVEAIEKDSIEVYRDENEKLLVKCIIVINNHERVETKFCYSESSVVVDDNLV